MPGAWVCFYLILWLPSCLVRQLRLWPQVGVDMTVGPCMICSSARLHCKPILLPPLNKALSVDKEHVSLPNSFHMPGTRPALQGMSFYSPLVGICISQLFPFFMPYVFPCFCVLVDHCSLLLRSDSLCCCSVFSPQCPV